MAKILLAFLSIFFTPPYEKESLVRCSIAADALCCTWEYPACYDYVQDNYCFSVQTLEWVYLDTESDDYEESFWDDHEEFLRNAHPDDLRAIQEYYWNEGEEYD